MTEISGSCLCGSIQISLKGPLEDAAYCHCVDCRKCTGSAFNISVGVEKAKFEVSSGNPKSYTKEADSGHELTRHFCDKCGSPIFTASPKHPGRFYVKAGILDDPDVVEAAYQSWVSSAVPWAVIDADLPAHEKGRA